MKKYNSVCHVNFERQFIYCEHTFFRKTKISEPLIRTYTCASGAKKSYFVGNFSYARNGSP